MRVFSLFATLSVAAGFTPAAYADDETKTFARGCATAFDMTASTSKNKIKGIEQDIISAAVSQKLCHKESGWEARIEGGGDFVDTQGRDSSSVRIGGGLYRWAKPSKYEDSSTALFSTRWIGINAQLGYEDFDLVFLRPGDCAAIDPGSNFPQDPASCLDGGFATLETRQEERTTTYTDIHIGNLWTGGNSDDGFLAEGHVIGLEGRAAYIDRRTPNTDDDVISFNESVVSVEASGLYQIPLPKLNQSSGLEIRAGYQQYFGDNIVIDKFATVSTRLQLNHNFSLTARYTDGNNGFSSWGLGFGLRVG